MHMAGVPQPLLRCLRAVAAAGLVATVVAGCDSDTPLPEHPREVTVVGSGHVQGVPDTLTANVGISFTASDVTSAMNKTNDRQQAVINAVVGAGVDRKNISTTTVSLQPQYAESGDARTITGYRADNALQITIHPPDAASHVLAVIVETGGDATRINSVSYSITDDAQLVKDARARAFHDAQSRADQYAHLSGLALGKVIAISEAASTEGARMSPAPTAGIAANLPLEPGQQTVSFSVTVIWELD